MIQYDFSPEAAPMDRNIPPDKLQFIELIKNIQQKKQEEHPKPFSFWCRELIEAVLIDFAEENSILLTFTENAKNNQVEAVLTSPYGFYITESKRSMKLLLSLALYIGIEPETYGEIAATMTLVFSFPDLTGSP